jgi:hypothetical protein
MEINKNNLCILVKDFIAKLFLCDIVMFGLILFHILYQFVEQIAYIHKSVLHVLMTVAVEDAY